MNPYENTTGCIYEETVDPVSRLKEENACLRREIRVAHQAAEITAQLVVEQFVKTDVVLNQFRSISGQLQAVLDAASQISIIATDLNGTITLFNKGAERILGYSALEMVGHRTPMDFHLPEEMAARALEVTLPGALPPEGIELFARFAEMGGTGIREWSYRHADGHCLPVSLSITKIQDTQQSVVGYLGVAMDITQIRESGERLAQANAELERANQDLKKLDQLKSEFLSSVSHELRTPLTSIRGFAQLIRRDFERSFSSGESDPKRKTKGLRILENLGIIQVESERLTRLINNVLDLAKIESGRTLWNDTTFPLHQAIRQAVNAVRGQFADKPQVMLRLEVDTSPWNVTADQDRLVQVLVNLLNNAAKFTERGEVRIALTQEQVGWVRVDIIDTGQGFAPEEAEIIFDKFQQAHQSDTLKDKPSGTGLGLSISREIVTHYGGRIWATSQPGVGSTFSLTLPVTETKQVLPFTPAEETSGVPGTELETYSDGQPLVLVVDDEPGVASYLSQFFQENGFAVVTASNGQEALEQARHHRPDLITMDLAMPVMDGRSAILHLRADAKVCRIPIIVLTAMPGKEVEGGDLVLSKPVDEGGLMNWARILTRNRRTGQKVLGSTPCLLLYDPELPTATPVPETISTGKVILCLREQILAQVQSGFQGLVVVPSELLRRMDSDFLARISTSKVLILPECPIHNGPPQQDAFRARGPDRRRRKTS
ncbi:MAG: ATP-binding protein [Magnetococcus sp. DMHC-1]